MKGFVINVAKSNIAPSDRIPMRNLIPLSRPYNAQAHHRGVFTSDQVANSMAELHRVIFKMCLFNVSLNLFVKQTCFRKFCKRFASVRVRFAPSPTGSLHLGGLRTALYNHLFAKSQNGVTILRIEDTDLARKVPEAAENLVEDLAWCGITFDEGPYFQSERKEIYKQYVQQLLDQGDAYYCFCSTTRLELIRREAVKLGQIPKYDNNCRSLTQDEVDKYLKDGKPACIRFKLSSFEDTFTDLIWGPTCHDAGGQEGDPVIFKGDGYPTYHFANVVDDHLMNITHVLRGCEWLMSTPKHLLLYKAFKWKPPEFGHFPLLLNSDGTKLSKRQGSVHVRYFKEKNYFPISLINFIIRFGGGFDFKIERDLKVYSLQELTERFDLSKIRSSSSQLQIKFLEEYNHAVLVRLLETENGRRELVKEIQKVVRNHFENSEHKNSLRLEDERVECILEKMRNRISNLEDFVNQDNIYLWVWESSWNEADEAYRVLIENLLISIKDVNWTQDDLKEFLQKFCKQYPNLKYSSIMQTLRRILTCRKVGPGVAEIMTTLPKEDVLSRLSKALEQKSNSAVSQN